MDRGGLSWDTAAISSSQGLMSVRRKDKEAGHYLDPAGKPQNYLSLFSPANDHESLSISPLFVALFCPHCCLCVGSLPPLVSSSTHSPCWVAPSRSFSSWFHHDPPCFPGLPDFLDKPEPRGLDVGPCGRDCDVLT